MLIDLIAQNLTPKSKELILKLKHQRAVLGKSKWAISSVDIYNGVLKHKLYTLDKIETNLK